MKNTLLLAAMGLAMLATAPAWADAGDAAEPAASAAASSASACPDNTQPVQSEGDPDAPQNHVEYGGGA